MKKLVILAVLLLGTVSAYAQYVPEWNVGDLKKAGNDIALQGVKLDRETTLALVGSVGGPEMTASWERYVRERKWGIGLTAGGYSLAVAGFCYGGIYLIAGVVATPIAAIGGQAGVDGLWNDLGTRVNIGIGVTLAGLAAGTTGVVLLCAGDRHLRGLVDTCNAAGLPAEASLTLGPTPSGWGLALRF